MKILTLLVGLFLPLAAYAADDALATTFAGKQTVYLRVVLEKPNGLDMRANVVPQNIIEMLEKQGKAVRPVRTSANVSYWAFFADGGFATCDFINNPGMADLSYEKIDGVFASAPRDEAKWTKKGDVLTIAGREYSVRVLDTDDAVTGGKKGEVEIAVLKGKNKVYYYFGALVQKEA